METTARQENRAVFVSPRTGKMRPLDFYKEQSNQIATLTLAQIRSNPRVRVR